MDGMGPAAADDPRIVAGNAAPEADDAPMFDFIELMFFAYRDFVGDPDRLLESLRFGRAHHRVLHFVNRQTGLTVAELLDILRITKQSLARVLNELVARDYVAQHQGRTDRRQRLLRLTPAGQALEHRLFQRQRDRIAAAYAAAPDAVDGFRTVMRGIMDESARAYIDEADHQSR